MKYLTDCCGNPLFCVPEIADLTSIFLRIWVGLSDSIFFHKIKTEKKKETDIQSIFFFSATKCIKWFKELGQIYFLQIISDSIFQGILGKMLINYCG